MSYPTQLESQNSWGWKVLKEIFLSSFPAQSSFNSLFRAMSGWVLNISKDGESTVSQADFLQCLTTLAVKCFFFLRNALCFSFCSVPLWPFLGHHCEEPGFLFFTSSPSGVYTHWYNHPGLLISRLYSPSCLGLSLCVLCHRPLTIFVALHWTHSVSLCVSVLGVQHWTQQSVCPNGTWQKERITHLPSSVGKALPKVLLDLRSHSWIVVNLCPVTFQTVVN